MNNRCVKAQDFKSDTLTSPTVSQTPQHHTTITFTPMDIGGLIQKSNSTTCLQIKAQSFIVCLECLAFYFPEVCCSSCCPSPAFVPLSHQDKCLGHFHCCCASSHFISSQRKQCWEIENLGRAECYISWFSQ